MLAPDLISLPPVSGGQSDVLSDVLRAGLDPAGAFGAAFALNRVVGNDRVNDTLNRFAGRTPDAAPDAAAPPAQDAPQTSLDHSAPSPMDGRTAEVKTPASAPKPTVDPAAVPKSAGPVATAASDATATAGRQAAKDAGEDAAKAAQRSMARAFAERGAGAAAREGAVLAAQRGAALGSRLAAMSLLRLGALSVPGLGTAITVVLWMVDTDGRKAFNNLIASVFGGGSEAPAIDAPPSPPRTHFLPLTNDGNRDGIIEGKDQGMSRTNDAAFRYHPDDVWPTSGPNIETTSNFADVANKVNALNAKLTHLVDSVTSIYQSQTNEPYVVQSWANTKPGVEALGDFQSTMLPTIASQLMAGANSANNAYQAFRGVNLKNRQEINNSTSGLIPFRANHVNEAHMSDSTGELKTAVDDMQRIAQSLTAAADNFAVKPNRSTTDPSGGTGGTPQSEAPADTAPPVTTPLPATPPAAFGGPAASEPKAADNPAKDLASLLRNNMPAGGMPMPGMGGMPQVPGMGGMPQIPGLGAGGPKPMDLADKPIDKASLQKALDDRLKNKDGDDAKKAPGDNGPGDHTPPGAPAVTGPAAVKATPAGHSDNGPQGAPPVNPASNTTEIGGRKWTFDNPKLANLAHGLTGTDGPGHKSIYQAAEEAGFKMPPPGQDIGQNVPVNQLKPGDVVMGANNHNGVFLGVVDNQAMAINEAGKVVPLSDIAQFDGPHQGFFRLADDGAPATPVTQPVADTGTAPPPAPPVAPPAAPPTQLPPTTGATDPGVIPGQNTGVQGLNPRTVPPNN